nr:hypothetical protein [uncultured Cardiobacterium sp.]
MFGWLYYGQLIEGVDFSTSMSQAAVWFEKAAMQRHERAQIYLGSFYENGLGVTQDYDKARAWYEKAAAQGDYEAERYLQLLQDRRQQNQTRLP